MSQGIFGVVDFNRPFDKPKELLAGLGKFFHGEDPGKAKFSHVSGPHHVFGMKRICESSWQQDKIFQDDNSQTFCLINGEIHNYHHLSGELADETPCAGDLDLIHRLYHLHGSHFARQLNGQFSLAILDKRQNLFMLLNDRFGMAHQVYWTVVDGRLYFASHLKILLACPGIRKKVDPEALNLFLKYSYISSPWSILQGIQKLPPGHILIFKDGVVEIESYWDFDQPQSSITDLPEAVSRYRELLKKSISNRLDTSGSVGILLSGGLDSSANVALATQCTDKKLKTFSIGFDDSSIDERPYARIVSRHFGTEHFEYSISGSEIENLPSLIWHLEEPYFELGLFLTYSGLATAQKEVDVILGGEAADQVFGTGGFTKGVPLAWHYLLLRSHLLTPASSLVGLLRGDYFYEHDNLAFKLRILANRVVDLNNWYFYGYDEYELKHLYRHGAMTKLPKLFPHQTDAKCDSYGDLYRSTQVNQDIRHYINENLMVKSGRMADMLDLTLRESYLDVELTDFLVSLDLSLKKSGSFVDHLRGKGQTKFLHRKAMDGLLPPEIMDKPKQGGFVPVMIFLKNPELRKRIYRHLLSSAVIKEYFRPEYLQNLFSSYEHLQGKKMYWHNFHNSKANRILFLLTFDIWHYFYMDNNALDITPPSLSEYLA
ncbi:MAG: asparagine synthase [Desulfuromusa sp.]|nr:asparagine synthase [Desulfuromusa sp.]